MSILLTGFEPNDNGLNASQILVESFNNDLPKNLSSFAHLLHFPPLPIQAQTQWQETPFMSLDMTRKALEIILLELIKKDLKN